MSDASSLAFAVPSTLYTWSSSHCDVITEALKQKITGTRRRFFYSYAFTMTNSLAVATIRSGATFADLAFHRAWVPWSSYFPLNFCCKYFPAFLETALSRTIQQSAYFLYRKALGWEAWLVQQSLLSRASFFRKGNTATSCSSDVIATPILPLTEPCISYCYPGPYIT